MKPLKNRAFIALLSVLLVLSLLGFYSLTRFRALYRSDAAEKVYQELAQGLIQGDRNRLNRVSTAQGMRALDELIQINGRERIGRYLLHTRPKIHLHTITSMAIYVEHSGSELLILMLTFTSEGWKFNNFYGNPELSNRTGPRPQRKHESLPAAR